MLFTTFFTAALCSLAAPQSERYRLVLDLGDGAELPFELELDGERVFVLNGDERIEIPDVDVTADRWFLGFPHFDSELAVTPREDGDPTDGLWRKVRGRDEVAIVPLAVEPDPGYRFPPEDAPPLDLSGRWRVEFASSDTPAVGLFEVDADGRAAGTFLTRTGDYRFLAGDARGDRLRLSCFDGAHAFLFDARLDAEGRLVGTFRSGNWWTESWTAVRDERVALPDPYTELELLGTTRVSETLALRPDGTETTLADLLAAQDPPPRAVLVQVLGTWCPNCLDETQLLTELSAKYAPAGLAVVGLCFELTGDVERDLGQIERYRTTRGVPYPLLWAGEADKADAARALGLTDRILSFPTTLFVNAVGDVDAIHSGFTGPAAEEEHARLVAEFEARIERLLDGPAPDRLRERIASATWVTAERNSLDAPLLSVTTDATRSLQLVDQLDAFCQQRWPLSLAGEVLASGQETFVLRDEPQLGAAFLQGLRLGLRLRPAVELDPDAARGRLAAYSAALSRPDRLPEPGLQRLGLLLGAIDLATALGEPLAPELLIEFASDPDAATRRAAIDALAAAGPVASAAAVPVLVAALDSADPRLRRAAAAALVQVEELDEPTRARLAELAAGDPFPSVRRAADR